MSPVQRAGNQKSVQKKDKKSGKPWVDDLRHLFHKHPPSSEVSYMFKLFEELDRFSTSPTVVQALAPLNQYDIRSILFTVLAEDQAFGDTRPDPSKISTPDRLASAVERYLSELPTEYVVSLPLQLFPQFLTQEYQLTEHIFIAPSRPQFNQSGRLEPEAQWAEEPTLKVTCNGYLDGTTKSSAAIAALSKVREFLYTCDLFGIIGPHHYGIIQGVTIPLPTRDVEWHAVETSHRSPSGGVFSSSALMDYLKSRRPYSGQTGLLQTYDTSTQQPYDHMVKDVKRLRPYFDSKDDHDLHGLRSAIEWAFASETSDDASMAFIQAFFSLESLLGANPVDRKGVKMERPLGSMGDRLADRFAYLCGTTRSDREQLESRFRNLYVKRGEIVHGKASKSSLEHLGLDVQTVQGMARRAIKSELDRYLITKMPPSPPSPLSLAYGLSTYSSM